MVTSDLMSFNVIAWLWSLAAIMAAALTTWFVSLVKRDVSIVDSLWSVLFLIATATYFAVEAPDHGPRAVLVLTLIALWAVRLSAHITIRNHGQGEDFRYQRIRAKNEPYFQYKSLYIVFGLQGFLAWVICLPALAAVSGEATPGPLDTIGLGIWLIGFAFEAIADWQLTRFRRRKDNASRVLDTGLWRYSRHPNYFGNAAMWWGMYLIAVSAGGWWTIVGPLLMTFLLLRVSGVALLERDIGERRPEYTDYIRRTNAFIPGPPKARTDGIDLPDQPTLKEGS
jgi:steroid 5-alpha reductase family enzyme